MVNSAYYTHHLLTGVKSLMVSGRRVHIIDYGTHPLEMKKRIIRAVSHMFDRHWNHGSDGCFVSASEKEYEFGNTYLYTDLVLMMYWPDRDGRLKDLDSAYCFGIQDGKIRTCHTCENNGGQAATFGEEEDEQ